MALRAMGQVELGYDSGLGVGRARIAQAGARGWLIKMAYD